MAVRALIDYDSDGLPDIYFTTRQTVKGALAAKSLASSIPQKTMR